ncbi:MAG: alcohol dehydrogenase catalytic domain-containing protein [Candidatus Dormibacterales bacterium]
MKAMCVTAYDRPLEMRERPRPEAPPGYALVKVLACGICFSDVKTIRGRMPYSDALPLPHVPGHEISGSVVEVNGPAPLSPGDRVVIFHNWACHRCAACRRGEENICAEPVAWMGFTHPGGFQEYVAAPVECLLPVPASIPATTAPALTCAIGTAYRAVAVRGAVRPGERVVVIGLGVVGVHAAQVASAAGATTLGVDRTEAKLAPARDLGLAALAVSADLEAATREMTEGAGADVVVETTGDPAMIERARAVARRGARIVAVGYHVGEPMPVLSDQFVLWEYSLLGSRYCSRADMEHGIQLVAQGRLRPVIGDVLPLEEANRAVERLEAGEATGRLVLSVAGADGAHA